jgi:molybdate transport system substrate-binding protein
VRRRAAFALALLASLSAASCGDDARGAASERRALFVAAAASLRELCEESAPLFEDAHPGARLVFSFSGSPTLARQIAAGADCDAFLSADPETLARAGERVDPATRTPFLANRLALVARETLAEPPAHPRRLAEFDGRIALAAPAVPAGRYARELLVELGAAEVAERAVSAEHVRATLALVEAGAADLALVYATDARLAERARTVWVQPAGEGPRIEYVAAALRPARSPLAADYVRWLRGPAFQERARGLGFSPPDE